MVLIPPKTPDPETAIPGCERRRIKDKKMRRYREGKKETNPSRDLGWRETIAKEGPC